MKLDRMIVIGGGNMARAIIGGAAAKGVIDASKLSVIEPDADRGHYFQGLGATVFRSIDSARVAFASAPAVLLAVKPQVLSEVELAMAEIEFAGLVVSILAGARSERVREALGGRCRVVRVMPNTPALVGMGISGICRGPGATDGDAALVKTLFRGVGEVIEIDESEMDAVTAVSGSGPAYLFLMAQAMREGAVDAGLAPEIADRLVRQTLRGSAELLARSEDTPETLRASVTSPGGTTAAAVAVLEGAGWRGVVSRAILAARDRGAELSGS